MNLKLQKTETDNLSEGLEEQAVAIKIAMADCLCAWSDLEQRLSLVFERLVQAPSPVAMDIWHSIVNLEAKLKALDSVFQNSIDDKEILVAWRGLRAYIRKKSSKRNEIAHATLITDSGKVYLSPYFSLNNNKTEIHLSVKDIVSRTEIFVEVRYALDWLIQALVPKVKDENDLRKVSIPPELIRRFIKDTQEMKIVKN